MSSDALRRYHSRLWRSKESFFCPMCRESSRPRDFEKHCLAKHHLNPRQCCVWCFGNVSWKTGQKNRRVGHLLKCWRAFAAGSVRLPVERTYEPVWPVTLFPHPVTLDEDGLNLAASCMELYLRLYHNYEADFYHVTVEEKDYLSFLRAMDEDEGRSRTLPFACWCAERHRHVIVVSDGSGRFVQDVWSSNFGSRYLRHPMDFVDTLGFLGRGMTGRFHVSVRLPDDYYVPLVMQWDGGLLEFLHDTLNEDEILNRAPLVYRDREWSVKIKDVPGLVLQYHVAGDLRPCEGPTAAFLYLINWKKIYFERVSTSTTMTDFKKSIRDVIGNEFLTLSSYY